MIEVSAGLASSEASLPGWRGLPGRRPPSLCVHCVHTRLRPHRLLF